MNGTPCLLLVSLLIGTLQTQLPAQGPASKTFSLDGRLALGELREYPCSTCAPKKSLGPFGSIGLTAQVRPVLAFYTELGLLVSEGRHFETVLLGIRLQPIRRVPLLLSTALGGANAPTGCDVTLSQSGDIPEQCGSHLLGAIAASIAAHWQVSSRLWLGPEVGFLATIAATDSDFRIPSVGIRVEVH